MSLRDKGVKRQLNIKGKRPRPFTDNKKKSKVQAYEKNPYPPSMRREEKQQVDEIAPDQAGIRFLKHQDELKKKHGADKLKKMAAKKPSYKGLMKSEDKQQVDELSGKTLTNYMSKRLSQTPPYEMDSKQTTNIVRAGQRLKKKDELKAKKKVPTPDVTEAVKRGIPLAIPNDKDYPTGAMKKDKAHHDTGGFRITDAQAKRAKERLQRKLKNQLNRVRTSNEENQLDELSPATLKSYSKKKLDQLGPKLKYDSKAVANLKRAGKQLYDKEYSKTGKPVKDKSGKTVGLVHSESSTWLQQTADTWNDYKDHKHPKVQRSLKKAEKAYMSKDYESFHRHTHNAANRAYKYDQQAKKKTNEATAAEILAKRMKSSHPDDNPQAFARTKSPIKGGPKTYKMHGKFQPGTGNVSQKGKTAALKKQLKRRPKQYGVTELYAQKIAKKMSEGAFKRIATNREEDKRLAKRKRDTGYPKSAQKDMNKMADARNKDWWKHQDKEMGGRDAKSVIFGKNARKAIDKRNTAKINKINNMGTRHGTY